jgi:hypothetical protein
LLVRLITLLVCHIHLLVVYLYELVSRIPLLVQRSPELIRHTHLLVRDIHLLVWLMDSENIDTVCRIYELIQAVLDKERELNNTQRLKSRLHKQSPPTWTKKPVLTRDDRRQGKLIAIVPFNTFNLSKFLAYGLSA